MHRVIERGRSSRKSRTSHSQVVDELGKAIVSGTYSVGEILPGDIELLQRFKVSRTVLRESMKTLAAKGLVVPRARVGTKVTEKTNWNMFDSEVLTWHFDSGVDRNFLLHLYDIRLAFEPFAAGLVAERASPDEIAQLKQLVDQMASKVQSKDSLANADVCFHMAIAEMSHNPFMRTLGSLIEAALIGIFDLSTPPLKAGFINIFRTHMDIVEAINAHDAEGAREAMRYVIMAGRRQVLESFRDETDVKPRPLAKPKA